MTRTGQTSRPPTRGLQQIGPPPEVLTHECHVVSRPQCPRKVFVQRDTKKKHPLGCFFRIALGGVSKGRASFLLRSHN